MVKYFFQKLHFKYLTRFWIRLCSYYITLHKKWSFLLRTSSHLLKKSLMENFIFVQSTFLPFFIKDVFVYFENTIVLRLLENSRQDLSDNILILCTQKLSENFFLEHMGSHLFLIDCQKTFRLYSHLEWNLLSIIKSFTWG